ncbi:MAG TPA: serpin family protein [Elusimicrobiales bacterium]|nr:serpin family protein [Elusimicrobiales bacterium]
MNTKKLFALLSVLTFAQAGALPGRAATTAPTPAERANGIAFSFYGKSAKGAGNVFFSPYSINTAFAMTYEGAKGKTAAEIEKVFGFSKDRTAARADAETLARDLAAAAQGAEFVQANSFWAQQDYKFLPAYLGVLGKSYGAEAKSVDFKTDTEGSRKAVNAWTEAKTKGKIKDLFQEGALTSLTRLVLVNAVYFKGAWAAAFEKARTRDADFTLGSGKKIKTPMMTFAENQELEYGEVAGTQLLRLPYKGGNLAMLVALPKDKKTMTELEKSLSPAKLAALRAALAAQKVKVFLPKFTFSSSFQLNRALAALGMPTAFTDAADFSGMDGTKKLFIQKAVHKAFVEVNEEGTEAAAATGVAMGLKSMDFDFALFRADRPFLFFIEDTKTGLLLFMGRMEDPAKQ